MICHFLQQPAFPIKCLRRWLPLGLLLGLLLALGGAYSLAMAQPNPLFSGTVTTAQGQPLPYASIAVDEARYGTLTDKQGNFSLRLPTGRHTLVVSHLGYRRQRDTLFLQSDLQKTYALAEEQLVLEEVLISSDGRDPAYGIMRQAINNKKANARPFPMYTYKAYTKTVARFQEGFEIDSVISMLQERAGDDDPDQPSTPLNWLRSDLLFLSENVSEVAVKEPNQIKENILSTRVSGSSDQFSFMGNMFNRFDPYKNRQVMQGVADRGLVSPVSDNAFFFYDFKLLGTVTEPGYKAYKIRLLPKREHDPVYKGTIYIADSSYAIKEVDWTATRTQGIELLDTLVVQQEFQRLQGAWVPFKSRVHLAFTFNMLLFEIPFSGSSTSLLSDYDTQPELKKRFFNNELIAISDTALDQDPEYWETVRPVPLTSIEMEDYQYKDSLEKVLNSPEYLDSLTRANRKVSLSDVLFGTEIRNYRKKTSWRINSVLNTLNFNAIEGWILAAEVARSWDLREGRSLEVAPRLRYSFGDEKFSYRLDLAYEGNQRLGEQLRLSGGDYVAQFSRFPQISFVENTYTSLFAHDSFIRLYRKRFAEANYRRELLNGLTLEGNLRYEDRDPLQNSSEYSLFQQEKTYDENLPLLPHQALIGEVTLRFRPFNRYISLPNGKLSLGSPFPLIELSYRRGVSAFGEGNPDFSSLKASMSKEVRLGLLGTMDTRLSAGRFLSTEQVFLPDAFHFKGNQTPFHFTNFDEFFLLPYYETSGTSSFVEAHLEHAFSGFIMNKIPGVRRLKLREYVGLHYLIRENGRPYIELNAGLEKMLLKVFPVRVDMNVRLAGDTEGRKWGFKIVLPLQSLESNE